VFAITQLTGLLTEGTPVIGGVRVLLVFGVLWWMYGGGRTSAWQSIA
jgi:hypothetical protein